MNLAKYLTVVSFIFAVMFLFAEFVLRLLYSDEATMFPRYHTDATYGDYQIRTVRPNSEFFHRSIDGRWMFRTNERGYRNEKNFRLEKPTGTIRVVSLGDSHTQGYEVHQYETYSAIVEKFLLRTGRKIEVINTGVSGFSTAEALVLLEHELFKYSPDYVVLGFYANDYLDNVRSELFGINDNEDLIEQNYEYLPGITIQNFIYAIPGIKWLGENSYFYSMLFNTVWVYAKTLSTERHAGSLEKAVGDSNPISAKQHMLQRKLIERMFIVCESIGAKFIIVDIPKIGGSGIEKSVELEDEKTFKLSSHGFISSSVLGKFDGVTDLHVRHGHRHISSFSHTMLGIEIAKKIVELEGSD